MQGASENKQLLEQVAKKILASNNVLVALSNNPTVDEMAGAIGLTMLLDAMGKRATAIYSGQTPNAIAFLKPDETFEANMNSLQDFIIALDKEKADHIKYKVDGDYVKVYITPYKTAISESDLVFSHGEFNVDLVIALNVREVGEFDNVLREHGRIMHDAGAINITTEAPGKLGELEWFEPTASSVSEMIADFAVKLEDTSLVTKPIATAILTGIVAATGRFSNEKTTPKTMALASRLMAAGADQQLIAANMEEIKEAVSEKAEESAPEVAPIEAPVEAPQVPEEKKPENEEVFEVRKETEKALESAPEVAPIEAPVEAPQVPEEVKEPEVPKMEEVVETLKVPEIPAMPEVKVEEPKEEVKEEPKEEPKEEVKEEPKEEPKIEPAATMLKTEMPEANWEPRFDSSILETKEVEEEKPAEPVEASGEVTDYGKMIEDALKEAPAENHYMGNPFGQNPAAAMAPEVAQKPEANNIPEMSFGAPGELEVNHEGDEESYLATNKMKVLGGTEKEENLPMPDEGILPPAPKPPVDFSQVLPEMPKIEEEKKTEEPKEAEVLKMPEIPKTEQSSPEVDAGAFKIPGA